jgi:uncharacterized protein (TIGR02594 family)
LRDNPALLNRLASLASFEHTNDPAGRSAVIQSLFNRAIEDNKTLDQLTRLSNRGKTQFYGPIRSGLVTETHLKDGEPITQERRDEILRAIRENTIRMRTDQGMPGEQKPIGVVTLPGSSEQYTARSPQELLKLEKQQAEYEEAVRRGGGRTTAVPSTTQGTSAQQPPAAPDARGGATSATTALDDAMKIHGLHERKDRELIKQYLRSGGAGMDPAVVPWCAAFVTAALGRQGIKGAGAIATSYLRWGQNIPPAQVQKGDVVVEPRGRAAGQPGGHVGIATGRTRIGKNGQLEIEVLGGNVSNRVGTTWEPSGRISVRRGGEAEGVQTAERKPSPILYSTEGELIRQREFSTRARMGRINLNIRVRGPRGIKTAATSTGALSSPTISREMDPTGGGQIESPA